MADLTGVLDILKWLFVKLNELLVFVAGFIAEKASLNPDNVMLILIGVLAILIANKITSDRGTKLLVYIAVIYAILYYFLIGGKIWIKNTILL